MSRNAVGHVSGHCADTHWAHTEALAAGYPRIDVDPDVLYVDNGSVLTSAGKAAAADLCLHLVRRDYGSKVASIAARRLVIPPHRAGDKPSSSLLLSRSKPTTRWRTYFLGC